MAKGPLTAAAPDVNTFGQRVSERSALTPVGGSQDISLIKGLDGLVTNITAATQQMANIVRDMHVINQRSAMFQGSPGQQMRSGALAWNQLGGIVNPNVNAGLYNMQGVPDPAGYIGPGIGAPGIVPTAASTPTLGSMPIASANPLAIPEGGIPAVPVPPASSGVRRGRGFGVSPASRGGVSPVVQDDEARQTPPFIGSSFEEGRGFSLNRMKTGIATRVDRGLSQWHWGQQLEEREGSFYPMDTPAGSPRSLLDEYGIMPASTKQVASFARRDKVAGAVKGIAKSMGDGEGFGAALGEAVPVAGMALAAAGAVYMGANKALDFSEGQRAANAEFQSVLGGSNSVGFGERAQQNIFRLGLRGSMSGAQAEALYKGGMNLYGGRTGGRNAVESIGVDLYKNLGVSVEETLGVLRTAVEGGNNSLYSVASALKAVTATAHEAAQNTEVARKNFEALYKTTTAQVGGVGAVGLAQAQTNVKTSLGPSGANVDLSGLNTEMAMRQAAQSQGLSYGQFTALGSRASGTVNGQKQGALLVATGQQSIVNQKLGPMLQNAQAQTLINDFMQKHRDVSGNLVMSPDLAQNLANQLQAQIPNMDPGMARTALEAAGITGSTDQNALGQALLLMMDPQSSIGGQAAANVASTFSQTDTMSPDDMKMMQGAADTARAGSANPADANIANGAAPQVLVDAAKAVGGTETTVGDFAKSMKNTHGSGSHANAMRRYYTDVVNSGRRYGVIEQYLKNGYSADDRFMVTTKDGSKKQVSGEELVSNYADQVQSDPGSISITGGSHTNSTFAEAFGTSGFTDPNAAGTLKGADTTTGKTLSDADLKKQEAKSGTVRIEASDDLKQWFKITGLGSVSSSPQWTTAQTGVPPTGVQPPGVLPTGSSAGAGGGDAGSP